MKRLIGRIALGVAGLGVLAAVAGATYETMARRRAVREFPPPGKLVDVGGRRIQIDCRGAGSPTVVLENGLDRMGSLGWAPVHNELAQTTRVCAYSRAGIMWSDPAPGTFDGNRVTQDLHAALVGAGEGPPWVLVGHSLGGPYALAFTGHHGSEVAGVVLVDASHPDQEGPMWAALGRTPSPLERVKRAFLLTAGPVLARLGLARLEPSPPPLPVWNSSDAAAFEALYASSAAAFLKEARAMPATLATAGKHRPLGHRPLVVLTRGARMPPALRGRAGISAEQEERTDTAWRQLQADQATWSTRSRHEVVDDARHYIHFDRPDVVVRAVREVVDTIRVAGQAPDRRPDRSAEAYGPRIAQQIPEFGGWFFDENGDLNVWVRNADVHGARARAIVNQVAAEVGLIPARPGYAIIIRQGQYGWQELSDWRDRIEEDVSGGIEGIRSVDLDERINRVTVGVDSEPARARARQRADELGIPASALNVQIEDA